MTEAYFIRFLEEIYSNFGRSAPAQGSPMYRNLHRRICEERGAIPDEAAGEIAYAFSEYDSLPQNVGKAILAEYSRWRANHPDRVARRGMCPDCDPRAGAGYVYLHDAQGRNYLARCVCNDDEDSDLPMATSDRIQALGLARGYVINPYKMDAVPSPSPEAMRRLRESLRNTSHKVRPAHLAQREAAGVDAYDAF